MVLPISHIKFGIRTSADGTNELRPRPIGALLSLILPTVFVAGNLLAARMTLGR